GHARGVRSPAAGLGLPQARLWDARELRGIPFAPSNILRMNSHGSCNAHCRVCPYCRTKVDACTHLATVGWRTVVVRCARGEEASNLFEDGGRDPRSTNCALRIRSYPCWTDRPVNRP